MSCAQGSPGSERAHRPCSPASVRTGPAGIPVRGCVDVRAHTREAREPRAYRSCTPLPPALPSSSSSALHLPLRTTTEPIQSVTRNRKMNCPTHKLRPCFQVPTDSQGLWGPHEQYLSDPWAPGHAVLCVWKPERRSFTHSRSHARSLKVRFFRSQSESSRTIHVGGRTDTTNRLSENHL